MNEYLVHIETLAPHPVRLRRRLQAVVQVERSRGVVVPRSMVQMLKTLRVPRREDFMIRRKEGREHVGFSGGMGGRREQVLHEEGRRVIFSVLGKE